jgi:hypothetical protein
MLNTNFKFTYNPEAVNQLIEPYFDRQVRRLHEHLSLTIDSPVFVWGTTTRRKNGQVVSDPRNAIDLGGLRDSQKLRFITPKTAIIEWTVPYASKVFSHAKEDLVKLTLERMKE